MIVHFHGSVTLGVAVFLLGSRHTTQVGNSLYRDRLARQLLAPRTRQPSRSPLHRMIALKEAFSGCRLAGSQCVFMLDRRPRVVTNP